MRWQMQEDLTEHQAFCRAKALRDWAKHVLNLSDGLVQLGAVLRYD